jgi:hypothetical protein
MLCDATQPLPAIEQLLNKTSSANSCRNKQQLSSIDRHNNDTRSNK